MKKNVLLLLVVALLASMLIACGPGNTETPTEPTVSPLTVTEPEMKNGVYQITKPGHVLYMAENPDKDYALCADVDMLGVEWTPVADFSGSLTGLIYDIHNYAISNISLQVNAGEGDVGLFRKVSGTIQEINFENITVVVNGTFTGNLGVVAGSCSTALKDVDVRNSTLTATVKDANVGMLAGKVTQQVTGCYLTGALNVTLAGGDNYVSGGIGQGESAITELESRVNITATENTAGTGAVGGLVGNAGANIKQGNYGGHLKVNANAQVVVGTLVGKLQGNLSNSYSCARSVELTGVTAQHLHYGSAETTSVISACYTRDTANLEEKTMTESERALRQKVVDYMYNLCTVRWSPSVELIFQCNHDTSNGHYQKYEPGTIYFGHPYTHGCASMERMEAYMNPDGTISTDVNTDEWFEYFGNDCHDAVAWAWNLVCGKYQSSYTGQCICMNGTVPVGGYAVTTIENTKDICKANGAQRMYEAYAQAEMGDAVLWAVGHIRMVAENAYVVRNADGSIDPDHSYILIHEQGRGTTTLDKYHSTCLVYGKHTFAELYRTNYIPITVEAFANGKADEIEVTASNRKLNKDGVGAGSISSNYRLKWVQISVTDANGNVVLKERNNILSQDSNNGGSEIKRHSFFSLQNNFKDAVKAMQLEAGKEYHYEIRVLVSDQEVVVQEYSFTA